MSHRDSDHGYGRNPHNKDLYDRQRGRYRDEEYGQREGGGRSGYEYDPRSDRDYGRHVPAEYDGGNRPRGYDEGYGGGSQYRQSQEYPRDQRAGHGREYSGGYSYQSSNTGRSQGGSGYKRGYEDYGDRGYGTSAPPPGRFERERSRSRVGPGQDRGYGTSRVSEGGDRGGYGGSSRGYSRDQGGRRDEYSQGGRQNYGSERSSHLGRGGGGGGGGRRPGGRGSGRPVATGEGCGDVVGAGYDSIGAPISDPRILDDWTGRNPPREVYDDDAEMQQNYLITLRTDYGTAGKIVPIQTNHFKVILNVPPETEFFKYHVSVERSRDAKYGGNAVREAMEDVKEDVAMTDAVKEEQVEEPKKMPTLVLKKSLIRMIINELLQQNEGDFDGIRIVHDGMSAIYAPQRLSWEEKTFANVSPDGPLPKTDGKASRGPPTFDVTVKLVEAIPLTSLAGYYKDPEVNVMPVLQALDVAARHLGSQRLIPVGRNLFSMKRTHLLKGGKELCWGYHQSFRLATNQLLLNMDSAATVFYAPGPLMDIVVGALQARDPRDIRVLDQRALKTLARSLRKIEIVPTHRSDRKKAINGLSLEAADATFEEIKGKKMSIAEYFTVRYNITLKYPNLPLVNLGRKNRPNWMPIELCQVAPGQRCSNITDSDTADIIRQTSKKPNERMGVILDQHHQANFETDPFMQAFGLQVDSNMINFDARLLETPQVLFSNLSERPFNGAWNLRDKRFVSGATLSSWGVLVEANVPKHVIMRFIDTLCDVGRKSGLNIIATDPVIIDSQENRGSIDELMMICAKEAESKFNERAQLILVIKRDANVGTYGDIKRMSDTVLGIPSQCVLSKNMSKGPQYCANVCLKINMKLRGRNWILKDAFSFLNAAPTIVIGADVEHPRSGMGSRPSIASVVASIDRYSSQYVARVAAQKTSDSIHELPLMLRDLLLAFYQNTSRKPEQIVYYRDGVSDSEYYRILQTEMKAIRKACRMMEDGYCPPVTFIVVNKRHHVRAQSKARDATDRNGNMIPGIVIDKDICDPHRFDFYLYGHAGIQGTSVPVHYTVLYDENKLNADDIQKLTYHLGYMFMRCTRSVSFVPPVYYAHLAAFRARFFLNEVSDGASTIGSSLSNSSNFDFCRVHESIHDLMYFI